MSYRDGSRGYRGPKLAIGTVVASMILGFFLRPVLMPLLERAQLSTNAGAKGLLLHHPAAGPVMTTLRDRFPGDFEQMVQSVNVAAGAADTTAIGQAIRSKIGALVKRDRHFLASAPSPTLATIREREMAILERLAFTSPTICAEFAETGKTDQPLSTETAALMLGLEQAILEAIAAGRDSPVSERRPTPTSLAAAREEMRAVLAGVATSPQAQEILRGERTLEQALPEHRCEAGRAVRVALNTIPAASADLLMNAP